MKNNFKTLAWVLLVSGFTFGTQAQTKKEIRRITSGYNLERLSALEKKIAKKTKAEKKQAIRLAKENGWEARYESKDGRTLEIQKVVDGKPIYYTTHNVAAARSTRANHLNEGGSLGLKLMGKGLTAHVWDGGLARRTHQEYDGKGGTNRFTIGDNSRTLNYHSAHVTGTIIASGLVAKSKGMAPYAKAVGYDWNSDKEEAVKAASNGMLISNHSYGFSVRDKWGNVTLPQHYFGSYIYESAEWDQILYDAPYYLMVVAAGNDGRDNTAVTDPTGGKGYDKLSGHATSKNNLVVANAQDAKVDDNGKLISVEINSSSSQGPTDDWRIKPDITGNGTQVYSTYEKRDNDYASITGTSMASPNVTGSLLLLQEHYKNLNNKFMRAATLKGLALHTADDAGPKGPDAHFGWGLLNVKRAAEVLTNNGGTTKVDELKLEQGQTYKITVESDGKSPLLASISWTDLAGKKTYRKVNSRIPVLVNDLDIRVTKGNKTYYPYRLTGPRSSAQKDNEVDPFERVDVPNASGKYTITIKHKGQLKTGSQQYSLVITGIKGVDKGTPTPDPDPQPEPGNPDPVEVTYCEAKARSSADEFIERVQLGSIDNKSTGKGYSDFTKISTKLDFTNTITVTTKWPGGSSYNEGYAVFIDYNRDGDFEDQGEIVLSQEPSKTAKFTGTFKLPKNVKQGATRMRVALKYKAIPSGCGVYKYGEVEDYTVIIGSDNGGGSGEDKEAPTSPTKLVASNIKGDSAIITWNASKDNVGVSGYQIFVNNKLVATVEETSATLTNLVPGTKYSVYVKAIDLAKNLSGSSNVVTITTGSANLQYCKVKGGSSKHEWIDYISIGGMENRTSRDNGYGDYTNKVGTVGRGQNVRLSVSAGFAGNAYSQYWGAWIDFNQDGQFSSSERVISGSSPRYSIIPVTIFIPNTAKLGKTRMRVVMKYGSMPSPCGNFGYGEVEDYTINIVKGSFYYGYDSASSYTVNSLEEGLSQEHVSDLVAYPNPAKDVVSVDLSSKANGVSYRILNTFGRLVKSGSLYNNTITISDLSSGVYVLEVNDGQRTLTTKLIKE